MGKGKIYILIYFLIFAIPLILSASIGPFGLSYLWDFLGYYAFYLVIGSIIILFGKQKIRNLVLLFQTGVTINWLLRIFCLPLLYHDVEVYRFTNILVFLLLFYIWYFFFHHLIKIRHIFFTLFLSVLSVLFFVIIGDISINGLPPSYTLYLGIIVDSIIIVVGLFLGSLLSLMKSKLKMVITSVISLIISFIVAIYAAPLIMNLLLYNSFTGETEIPVSFLMRDKKGVVLTQKDIDKKYRVVYVWESNIRRYYDLQKLEYYYWKYKSNKDICFYVVAVCKDEKPNEQALFEKYDLYHVSMPLYIVLNPSEMCNQIGDCKDKKLVCIMRNDTVIYRNEMSKAGEYLDDLMRKKR